MKNKNKLILFFSIFFIVGLGYCFPNVPLVKAATDFTNIMSDPDRNTRFILEIPSVWNSGTPPTLTFNASAQASSDGLSTNLTWASKNATSCTASASPANSQWSGPKNLSGSQTINITSDTTFSLLCSGSGGSITKSVLFTLSTSSTTGSTNYFPTLTFYISAAQSSSDGASTTLDWTSTNTTSCTASASPANSQWSGVKDVSGSQAINNITTSIAFSLTCSGTSGSITRGMTFTLASISPTLTFYYTSPTTVSTNSYANLTWASTNTTSCTASASPANSQWSGSKDLSGSQTISDITTDTTFTLLCSTAEGNITKTVLVPFKKAYSSIPVVPIGPPILTLYANPTQISPGGSADLIWASNDTTSCTASASPANSQWSGTKDLSGSQTINNITTNTTFSLACSGTGGNTNDAALIALKSASSSVLDSTENQNQKSQLQSQRNQILAQIAQLQSKLKIANDKQQTPTQPIQQTNSNGDFCYTFTGPLKYKDTGYIVGALQAILQKEGLLNIAKLTTYFGEATLQAVIAFQEKYKSEILAPVKLTKGNGFVGILTRAKLNQLYGCVTTINTATNTASSATNQTAINPISSAENQTTTTTPQCQTLWWYDNYNKTCQQKQFCGSYMYLGLQTFGTEADCKASLPVQKPTIINPNLPPIINEATGPAELKTNRIGTWAIKAYDPESGILNYKINWGDGTYDQKLVSFESQSTAQSITHSYVNAGTYTIEVVITDDHQNVVNKPAIVIVDLPCDQQCKAKGWTNFDCAAAKIKAGERTCCCYEPVASGTSGTSKNQVASGGPDTVYFCYCPNGNCSCGQIGHLTPDGKMTNQ